MLFDAEVWLSLAGHNSSQSEGHEPTFPIPSAHPTPTPTPSTSPVQPSRSQTSTTGTPMYLGPYAPPPPSPKSTTTTTTSVPPSPALATAPTVKIVPPGNRPLPPTPRSPTLDDSSTATTNSSPSKVAPTADPSHHPKPHKHHPYYIGPFAIGNDNERDPSDPDFIPGPFNPNLPKPQNDSSKAEAPVAVAKPFHPTLPTPASRPSSHPGGPPFVYQSNQQSPIPVYISPQHEQPQYHSDAHSPYPVPPEYQLVHVNNQGYPGTYPKQPSQGVPPEGLPPPSKGSDPNRPPLTSEELYRLQSGQQTGAISSDPNHEVYYVHGLPKSPPSSPQDVYHIVPHSPGVSVPIEEIIAHIRQREQQSEQQEQQKPVLMQPDDYLQGHLHKQGRPNPAGVQRPPILPPYSVPVPVAGPYQTNLPGPLGHGHGHGLGDEDDLSTETSRHPAPQQQLGHLISNQSYTGWCSRQSYCTLHFVPSSFYSSDHMHTF